MELEELKKSWNALDEHLKDKELIKEEELGKLIGHADKGIHAIARLNIKLILISLPVLVLFLLEVLLHGRLNPIYIIIILSWIPALYWDITTTRFLQQTKVDEMPLIENKVSALIREGKKDEAQAYLTRYSFDFIYSTLRCWEEMEGQLWHKFGRGF